MSIQILPVMVLEDAQYLVFQNNGQGEGSGPRNKCNEAKVCLFLYLCFLLSVSNLQDVKQQRSLQQNASIQESDHETVPKQQQNALAFPWGFSKSDVG